MRAKEYLIFSLYFFFTIIVFGSFGVWLPFIIDDYNYSKPSVMNIQALPNNIITYALSIFFVATIDRIIYLFKKSSKYDNIILEFLLILAVIFTNLWLVYKSVKCLKFNIINRSILYACIVDILAWGAWIYVKVQNTDSNNFSSIGGII